MFFFDILISKIMRQASEDAFVGPTNPSALAKQGGDGAQVNGIEMAGEGEHNNQHGNWDAKGQELRMYGVAIAELEADGVSQFIERMNNPIDPLIDGNGNSNQEDSGDIQDQA